MQRELTDICYSRKHHAASTHADAQSVSEWQSPSQPGQGEETQIEEETERDEQRTQATLCYFRSNSTKVN